MSRLNSSLKMAQLKVNYVILIFGMSLTSSTNNVTTAPDDYEAVVATLRFQQGTDGSRPSHAACVTVFIFDDAEPEETESLSFHIRSLDTSAVRIAENCDQITLYLLDNDGGCNVEETLWFAM